MNIESYNLSIPGLIEITFLNFGGIIQRLSVPDKDGKLTDIVLGFDEVEHYKNEHPYFGSLVGRFANRIAGGKFNLDNREYHLPINNGPNSLHGGLRGFDKVFWKVRKINDHAFELTYRSPDGEEGYPGNLDVNVIYSVNPEGSFIIQYEATSDKKTVLNLTNHSYLNLSGDPTKDILNHELWINADSITEIDADLTPTGNIISVNQQMDFRQLRKIDQGGYDHNYVLRPGTSPKVRLKSPESGITLEIETTCPGVQFYSGNFLDGNLTGKGRVKYNRHAGLCLETQYFPDSPNHPNFPSTILEPSETFRSKTIFRFLK